MVASNQIQAETNRLALEEVIKLDLDIALYEMILAEGYRLPLLRVAGLVFLAAFVSALIASRAGAIP